MAQTPARRGVSGRQLRRQQKDRNWILIGGAAVIALIIVGALVYFFTQPREELIPSLGDSLHLNAPDQPLPEAYNSNPPTSGWHWGGGAEGPGVKTTPISDTITVHSLEHGFVIIHYRQDTDQATVDRLATLTRQLQQLNPCIILEPRPVANLDVPIAVTSWTYLLKLDGYDENAIRGFFQRHVGRGPEQVCPIGT